MEAASFYVELNQSTHSKYSGVSVSVDVCNQTILVPFLKCRDILVSHFMHISCLSIGKIAVILALLLSAVSTLSRPRSRRGRKSVEHDSMTTLERK